MADDRSESVLNVLGDPKTRELLATINENPLSAKELSEELDTSSATVYRRLELLAKYKLAHKDTVVSPDGNHYTVYESNFVRATIIPQEAGYDVTINRKDEYPNKLTEIWDVLKQG